MGGAEPQEMFISGGIQCGAASGLGRLKEVSFTHMVHDPIRCLVGVTARFRWVRGGRCRLCKCMEV